MIYQRISLKPKVDQHLKLSPDTIQHLKVLQLNQLELNDYINSELESNPLLEKDESPRLSSDELYSYFSHTGRSPIAAVNNDDEVSEVSITYRPTLFEHLASQLDMLDMPEETRRAARILIYSLDERGYLRSSLAEISSHFDISPDLLELALGIIQSLEPRGVGARDLCECLILQIDGVHDSQLIETIISNHLELIASNKLIALSKKLNVSLSKLESLIGAIRSLDPKPGLRYESSCYSDTEYIVPDITVEIEGESLVVKTIDSLYPRLMINDECKKLLLSDSDPESREFLTDRLNRAIFVIRSIEQRKSTILSVSESIVSFQSDFFLGRGDIIPLNLSDIAISIGVHESTVSRAIRGKYLSSPVGIYPLKFFFSNKQSADSDSSVSDIKKAIKAIVDGENPLKPYSDQKLCDMLSHSNLNVARRTVAKYREALGIKSSSLRKLHK